MKHLATKERKRDREEFVHMYRYAIEILLGKTATDQHVKIFIDGIVRKQLGFSCKTATCDIWTSINKTYHQLYNKKAPG